MPSLTAILTCQSLGASLAILLSASSPVRKLRSFARFLVPDTAIAPAQLFQGFWSTAPARLTPPRQVEEDNSAWADASSPTSRPTTSANAISTDAHASAAAVDADLFVAVPVTASTATADVVSAIFLYAHARSIAAIISRGVRPR